MNLLGSKVYQYMISGDGNHPPNKKWAPKESTTNLPVSPKVLSFLELRSTRPRKTPLVGNPAGSPTKIPFLPVTITVNQPFLPFGWSIKIQFLIGWFTNHPHLFFSVGILMYHPKCFASFLKCWLTWIKDLSDENPWWQQKRLKLRKFKSKWNDLFLVQTRN